MASGQDHCRSYGLSGKIHLGPLQVYSAQNAPIEFPYRQGTGSQLYTLDVLLYAFPQVSAISNGSTNRTIVSTQSPCLERLFLTTKPDCNK